jgi:small GTP-binding protein
MIAIYYYNKLIVLCRHYRKAHGALLVYDITKGKTFESVLRWMEELKTQADPDIVIVLVGNKVDLVERDPSLRQVTIEEAQLLAYENDMLFEETSAITSQNVVHVFEKLLKGKENVKGNV